MTNKKTRPSNRDTHDSHATLDSRYGSIGISAVAAALQFKGDIKNPAYAPGSTPTEEQKEMAA